jgi:OmpA-OmpF porin, OOP family
MKLTHRQCCAAVAAGVGIAAMAPIVHAQTSAQGTPPSVQARGYSLLPFTHDGYVGVNLGKSQFKTPCGATGFPCEDSDTSGRIYTGGMFNRYLGLELGYLHMGRIDRAGGRSDAQGLNLSLVGRAPMGAFNAFAKGGATYGRTHVSSDVLSGVSAGTEKGWGPSYGVGVGYDLSQESGIVLEWERHQFRFAGGLKDDVESTTLGFVRRF